MKDRDEKGRFVKGNPGNPQAKGRPKKVREQRYYEIAMSAVTFEQWKKIIEKAAQQAERGDGTARRFLADYLLPTPAQRLELTGALGGPIEVSQVDDIRASLESKLRKTIDLVPEEEILARIDG